jgi:hypothetical protein
MAFFVCNLMNVSGKSLKRHITPKELLKPLRESITKGNKKADEAYLKEKFGLNGGGDDGDNS